MRLNRNLNICMMVCISLVVVLTILEYVFKYEHDPNSLTKVYVFFIVCIIIIYMVADLTMLFILQQGASNLFDMITDY